MPFTGSVRSGALWPNPVRQICGIGFPSIFSVRAWEDAIRGQWDFDIHLDSIHYNPVKHGWVHGVCDGFKSGFLNFVRLELYPLE